MKTDSAGPAEGFPAEVSPDGVVFDTNSGISLEEQREILASINAMTGGSRPVRENVAVTAKKKGILFPLSVNFGALVLLGVGFALLIFFNAGEDREIREDTSLSLPERELIREIREETNLLISEKESEINDMRTRLAQADAEYKLLLDSVETLSAPERERAAYLLGEREEYSRSLGELEEARASIIEDSRIRETALRVPAAATLAESEDSVAASIGAGVGAVPGEFSTLSSERELAARVDDQLNGFYAALNERVESGRLEEAALVITSMREFLGAPLFGELRSLEAKKATHLAAIDAMEKAVNEARRLEDAASAAGAERSAEAIAALEQKVRDQETLIAASGAEGSQLNATLTEFRRRIDELGGINGEQARRITDLSGNVDTLNRRLEAESARASESESELATLREAHDTVTRERDEVRNQYAELQRRLQAAVQAVTGE